MKLMNSARTRSSALLISTFCLIQFATADSFFDTSYKCTARIVTGFTKEEGDVDYAKFRPTRDYFVTHTSDFSASTVDAWLELWEASEEQMNWAPEQKKAVVRDLLLDKEASSESDTTVIENGSYFVREASEDPSNVWSWDRCEAFSYKDARSARISCFNFEMDPVVAEFTSVFLGSIHRYSRPNGFGVYGDTPYVEHGTCAPYYPQ